MTDRAAPKLTGYVERLVFKETGPGQLLMLAAGIGILWALGIFPWSFIAGSNPFWRFPVGTISGPDNNDMAQVLVGYLYYVRSPWHFPLFYVSALGTPGGTNVIFMDVVPIVALIGKVVHSLGGVTANPYGVFLFLCFALPGVMMTLVLIAARVRYALATVIGAVFADTIPALLFRWGHIALQAHFLLIGALALYLFSLRRGPWRGLAALWAAFLALVYLTNIYLFAMAGAVWLCLLVQRCANEPGTTRVSLRIGALTVGAVTVVIAVGGQFGAGGGLPFNAYGYYSMNLLSPFVPQKSGLLPGFGGIVDATGFQYEGFNYLGLGLLIASVLVLPAELAWLKRNLRRHAALSIALAAMTVFAVSNRVYAGHWLIFQLPLPHDLDRLLGIFHGSGRFFWLIGYVQIAMVVVLGFRAARPAIPLCLAAAVILQIVDVHPLQAEVAASIARGPGWQALERHDIARLIAGARHIEVVPSFQCTDDNDMKLRRANMELMLATARANIPTNTVYSARERFGETLLDILRHPSGTSQAFATRRTEYCNSEIAYARSGGLPGDVLVLLSDRPKSNELAVGVTCTTLSWARFCDRSKK